MIERCLLLDLTDRYSEPHRHYHTLEHIASMLHLGRGLDLSDEQKMAIWYHDAIYDSHSNTNEEDSAELARVCLPSIGWDEERISRVAQMVQDTKGHEPSTPESAYVIDLDLSSIGAGWHQYERNRKNIRREYEWIPEDDFQESTRRFLERFLARDQIYWTEWGKQFEAPARANMQRALEAMGRSSR